ncbi:Adaptive-response sensory-kinase SasA [Nocardioides sp. T2.26MG-1]|nr:Adaptive-response sensory-kinase SasA [Nocardioides sp. T2.26MG-1]
MRLRDLPPLDRFQGRRQAPLRAADRPRTAWGTHRRGWRDALAIIAVVASLQLVHLTIDHSEHAIADLASQATALTSAALLASSGLLYFDARTTDNEVVAWLAAAVLLLGLAGGASITLERPGGGAPQGWPAIYQAVLIVVALGLVALSGRPRYAGHPLGLGVLGGTTSTLVALTLLDTGLLPRLPPTLEWLAPATLALAYAALTIRLYHLSSLPGWFRVQLGLTAALLGVSQVAAQGGSGHLLADSVTIVGGVVGAACLWSGCSVLLQRAMSETEQALVDVRTRVHELEGSFRADRARMHEVDATLAGIASAADLLHDAPHLPPQRRRVLQAMVRSESARLVRQLAEDRGGPPRPVPVDAVLEPLVERQRLRGVDVAWSPTGIVALAEPGDLGDALSVLLENAVRHAPGSTVRVECRRAGSPLDPTVEILVSDSGAGVAPEVRARLFDWGARGPQSPGQGIGLYYAAQLVNRHHGELRLADTPAGGATFMIRISAARRASDGHLNSAIASTGT